MFFCMDWKFTNFFQDTLIVPEGEQNENPSQFRNGATQWKDIQLRKILMVAVEFPVRRDKKPFLEKSQINISQATSNSASEGL